MMGQHITLFADYTGEISECIPYDTMASVEGKKGHVHWIGVELTSLQSSLLNPDTALPQQLACMH
jgi:hypothetical protein